VWGEQSLERNVYCYILSVRRVLEYTKNYIILSSQETSLGKKRSPLTLSLPN
jgi:hypothetical protein